MFNIIAVFWFVAKMTVLLLAFIWVRATVPRLRADQLMRFAWLLLIPLTLFNIVLTGALLLLPIGQTGVLVASGAANWLLTLAFIFGLRRIAGISPFGRLPRWLRSSKARAGGATAQTKASTELAGTRS